MIVKEFISALQNVNQDLEVIHSNNQILSVEVTMNEIILHGIEPEVVENNT